MSISPIGSTASNAAAIEPRKAPAPAPTPQTPAATIKPDTVALSSAAHAPVSSGDVDHDGDSH